MSFPGDNSFFDIRPPPENDTGLQSLGRDADRLTISYKQYSIGVKHLQGIFKVFFQRLNILSRTVARWGRIIKYTDGCVKHSDV